MKSFIYKRKTRRNFHLVIYFATVDYYERLINLLKHFHFFWTHLCRLDGNYNMLFVWAISHRFLMLSSVEIDGTKKYSPPLEVTKYCWVFWNDCSCGVKVVATPDTSTGFGPTFVICKVTGPSVIRGPETCPTSGGAGGGPPRMGSWPRKIISNNKKTRCISYHASRASSLSPESRSCLQTALFAWWTHRNPS